MNRVFIIVVISSLISVFLFAGQSEQIEPSRRSINIIETGFVNARTEFLFDYLLDKYIIKKDPIKDAKIAHAVMTLVKIWVELNEFYNRYGEYPGMIFDIYNNGKTSVPFELYSAIKDFSGESDCFDYDLGKGGRVIARPKFMETGYDSTLNDVSQIEIDSSGNLTGGSYDFAYPPDSKFPIYVGECPVDSSVMLVVFEDDRESPGKSLKTNEIDSIIDKCINRRRKALLAKIDRAKKNLYYISEAVENCRDPGGIILPASDDIFGVWTMLYIPFDCFNKACNTEWRKENIDVSPFYYGISRDGGVFMTPIVNWDESLKSLKKVSLSRKGEIIEEWSYKKKN